MYSGLFAAAINDMGSRGFNYFALNSFLESSTLTSAGMFGIMAVGLLLALSGPVGWVT